MTSFGYRLNPRYAIKECLSCGALYTGDFCCLKGNVEDKILVPKLPKNYARCPRYGHPINGPYCQGCTLLREKLEEDMVTYFKNFPNASESSDGSTNVVNAPPCGALYTGDHGVNTPHIDECCCECGDALDGIFCQQCTCKSCGKGAHIGYNCPPKVPIISNPEPVEDLVSIPSESKGIPDTMCDVHLVNNPTPLEAKDHFEIIINSKDDISSSDDDSLYNENIEYVEASPHDSKVISLEVAEIVILEDEEIEDDNLREKMLNFPPTDRSDFIHEEFADELAHIISPPEYDCFYFRNLPDLGKWIPILNSRICENLSSTTRVNLPVEDDHSPILAYVVWIFLAYLTYLIIPPYLHSFGNEDTIFDPGISINHFYSFKPGLSHWCGTFKKFNTHRSHLNESSMEILFSTCFLMDQ
nr:hypothetical protein [Tanacetum cinerariifolium]